MTRRRFCTKGALWLTAALLLGTAALLTACQPTETPTPCPEVECPETIDVPFEALWTSSPHNDASAEAFVHWDEDDPPEVPARCARCHSTPGYLDFLGVDGTEAGTVDNAAETGTTVACVACHNEATHVMDSVAFPSGLEVAGLGDESRCMQCHQGRASTTSVDDAIAETGLTDEDGTHEDLGFVNIHYYAAAATQFGTLAKGGYEYAGKSYDAKFAHVEMFDTCIECHDSHTLELKIESCAECHTDVASVDDLKNVRLAGSMVDYDGDGDTSEGIYYEIQGLQELLYQAIQAYGDAAGTPITYDPASHPYFFDDVGEEFAGWTPRLLKATYNYQTSIKDPGAFAHGGKYIIQLLYDSIEDLDAGLVKGLRRIDAGHFAGSEEAWRHWDGDGEVASDCAKCHSAAGLPTLLKDGANVSEPPSSGLLCATCHDAVPEFTRRAVEQVAFPSGARLDTGNADSNLCLNCHQGRDSTVSMNRALADLEDDTAYAGLSGRSVPKNVHYFAAGATLFGTEAKGAYEYAGRTYNGRFLHAEGYSSCIQCHDAHSLELNEEACSVCHPDTESPEDIRMSTTDFDGDGDTDEGIAGEIGTVYEALYAAMQDYAANVAGAPIIYASNYPYFFIDTDGDGEADAEELDRDNSYAELWTPRLLRASYNYLYVAKDPGAFAHNGEYVIQILYDSLADLGGSTSGMTRPVPESE